MRQQSAIIVVFAALLTVHACGESTTPVIGNDPFTAYEDEKVTFIGSAEELKSERIAVSDGDVEAECLELADNLCVAVDVESSSWCEREGGPIDVVMVDGEVVDVICYPPADGSTDNEHPHEVVDSGTDSLDVVKSASNTSVVFDESTNGEPIVGDADIDGNNVSYYGNGPENTVIEGDVKVDGNNVRLRGMTITGDLVVSKNHVSVVLCRILGNVILSGGGTNNSIFVENDVFGNFETSSNGHTLTGNEILGEWLLTGNEYTCDDNVAFSDENENQFVDDGEQGELLSCDSQAEQNPEAGNKP